MDRTKHHVVVVVLYKYSAERTAANLYKKKLWTLTTNSCLHPPAAILFPLPASPKITHETNRSHTACLPACLYIYSYVCSWCSNSIKKIKELSKEASSSTDPTTPASTSNSQTASVISFRRQTEASHPHWKGENFHGNCTNENIPGNNN